MISFWELYSLLTLIYIIPCYTFYIYFAVVLFRRDVPQFSTPFFNLIKLLSIIDLTLLPLFYGGYRLGHVQIFRGVFEFFSRQPNTLSTIYVYIFCVLQHSQLILHLIMAFNRFTATIMVKGYKDFWDVKRFWIIMVIVFGIPGCYMCWLCIYGGYFRWGAEHQGFMLDSIKSGSNIVRLKKHS